MDESRVDRPTSYVARHDWESSSPLANTVIEVLDEVPQVSLRSEAALYERIDIDAVEPLFRHGDVTDETSVRFDYQGCEIVIKADGTVTVWPGADRRRYRSGPTVGD